MVCGFIIGLTRFEVRSRRQTSSCRKCGVFVVLSVQRRPYGYWKDPANRVKEIVEFAEAQNDPQRMPTERELREAGRIDISNAIRRNGGWQQAAKESNLVLSSISRPRSIYLAYCVNLRPGTIMKPYNFWKDFENLKQELQAFIDGFYSRNKGEADRKVPLMKDLELAKRYDLIRAIHNHGGMDSVIQKMDLQFRYRSSKYWRNFENVEKEIRLLLETFGEPMMMPRVDILRKHGPPGLGNAVRRIHGGKTAVAQRIGLNLPRKPRGYWCNRTNRENAVLDLIAELKRDMPGCNSRAMPTKYAMIAAGRADLAQAIERHGGVAALANSLGLTYDGKPRLLKSTASRCVCYNRTASGHEQ